MSSIIVKLTLPHKKNTLNDFKFLFSEDSREFGNLQI